MCNHAQPFKIHAITVVSKIGNSFFSIGHTVIFIHKNAQAFFKDFSCQF
jgi:hypothetical protein